MIPQYRQRGGCSKTVINWIQIYKHTLKAKWHHSISFIFLLKYIAWMLLYCYWAKCLLQSTLSEILSTFALRWERCVMMGKTKTGGEEEIRCSEFNCTVQYNTVQYYVLLYTRHQAPCQIDWWRSWGVVQTVLQHRKRKLWSVCITLKDLHKLVSDCLPIGVERGRHNVECSMHCTVCSVVQSTVLYCTV